MVLIWWEYAIISAIFAGTLAAGVRLSIPYLRVRVQKWAGGAIGNFWTSLSEKAEEGGLPGPSTIELGGLKIDPAAIQQIVAVIPQIVQGIQMIQSLGFLKGGGGGGAFKP